MEHNGFYLSPSERLILIAKTGAGKTYLAKHLLRAVAKVWPVVIVDPNMMWLGKSKGEKKQDWAGFREPGTIDKPHKVTRFNPSYRVQCVQPDEGKTDLERVCKAVFQRGGVFIYFDETEGIATANSVPEYIRLIWKRGRARNIGAWAATQVPTGIPRLFKSQSEHRIVLKVGEEDAKLAASVVHVTEQEVLDLHKYEYIYYNTDMDRGERHGPLKA